MAQRKSDNGAGSDAEQETAAEANVDKIRDIIFGGQMRDYERRFDAVEKEIERRITRISSEFDKKVSHLEAFAKREIEKADKLRLQEKKERSDALAELGTNLVSLGKRLEEQLAALDEHVSAENSDIRHEIESSRLEIVNDTKELVANLTDIVRSDHDELQNSKADRLEIAGLFTEVAMRLNREFELPEE